MAGAVAQHGGHWRQQHRRLRDFQPRIGDAERIHPADFRKQPDDLPERIGNADEKHTNDQAVQSGVGHEGGQDLGVENGDEKGDEDQEDDHAPEKHHGFGKGHMSRIGHYE